MLFEKISSGKVKIEIFKKYKLNDVVQSHEDLESRKIIGPAIILPNYSNFTSISDICSFKAFVER